MQAFKKHIIPAIALATLGLVASAAQADTYDLTLVGTNNYTAHWLMDSSPVVQAGYGGEGQFFTIDGVQGNFNGLSQAAVSFINNSLLGGIIIQTDIQQNPPEAYAFGAQVYSGSELAPTLLLGSYTLVGSDFATAYTLTITQAAAPVPEPESYALMLAGLGALGFVVARRRKV